MPDKRRHRGARPEDDALFAPSQEECLRTATDDLSWLLGRGYTYKSALKLVGDRYALRERQRMAVLRSACSVDAAAARRQRCIPLTALKRRSIELDGYNVLTTAEAALAGGFLFRGRDGCLRDLASIHGTYHKVVETAPALLLLGTTMAGAEVGDCTWYLDRPVSNSGRLKAVLLAAAAANGWPWRVELVLNPDAVLCRSSHVVATADSVILDHGPQWVNLLGEIISQQVPEARVVDLSAPGS